MRQASLQRSLRAHWVVRKQRTAEQVHGLLFLLSVGTSFRLRNSKQVLVAFGEGIWGHILVSQVLTTFGAKFWFGPNFGQASADHFWERNFGAKFRSVKC